MNIAAHTVVRLRKGETALAGRLTHQSVLIALAILMGLLVFAGKAWLIGRHGSPVPQGDQWDMECSLLYAAWQEGTFDWGDLLRPANEHRIVFTQLVNLGLFVVNGYWDPRVQMLAGAALQAVVFALIAGWGMGWIARERWVLFFALLMVVSLVPLGWENTLWGCQSQFYWMVLLAWGAIWGWTAEGGILRRLTGTACLLAGPFTMSGGVLAAPVVVLVRFWGAVARRRWGPADSAALLIAGTTVGLAVFFWTKVPEHDVLKSADWGEFSLATLRLLAWPWTDNIVPGLFLWLPWLIWTIAFVSGRTADTEKMRLIVGLGGWIAAQILAMAWARGGTLLLGLLPSRYADLLLLGLIANGLVLLSASETATNGLRWRAASAAAWFVIAGSGVAFLTWHVVERVLPNRSQQSSEQLARVSDFLVNDRFEVLAGKTQREISFWSAERLAGHLRRARAANILPPELRGFDLPLAEAQGISSADSLALGLGIAQPAWRSPEGHKSPWRWMSPPLTFTSGLWQWCAFADGTPGVVRFDVVAVEREGETNVPIVSRQLVPGAWQRWQASLPAGSYRLSIVDKRVGGITAWVAPARLGPLSAFAVRIFEHAFMLGVLAATGLAVLSAVLTARPHGVERPT